MVKIKLNSVFLVFFCLVISISKAANKPYQAKLKQRLVFNAQHLLDGLQLVDKQQITSKYSAFPTYYSEDVDTFLLTEMAEFNVKMHPMILEYITFWTTQPTQNIRSWMGINTYYSSTIHEGLSGYNLPQGMQFLPFSQVDLLPQINEENGRAGAWQLFAPIAIAMGGTVNNQIDERRDVKLSSQFAGKYLQKLYQKYNDWTLATTAFVCGASALNKALIANGNSKDYWDLYPFLPQETRDFYPAMLAAAFVLENKKWKTKPYLLKEEHPTKTLVLNDTVSKKQLIHALKLEKEWFDFANAEKVIETYLPNEVILIPQELVVTQEQLTLAYEWKRQEFFPIKEDSCYVFYHTNRGDYFKDLTRWFGYSLAEIKEMNGLSSNTLSKNDDVFFRFPKKDSLLYADFDNMTNAQKDIASGHEPQKETVEEKPEPTPIPDGAKVIYYTVKSGDTLWKIAQEYNTTDTQLQEWNQIGSNIRPGQKIKIYTGQ